jgi:hypothetical protein
MLTKEISPKYLDKHLPNTPMANKVLRKDGNNHVFNDRETLGKVEQEILQNGKYTGTVRGTERYGKQFDQPIGYRIDKNGNTIPLHYGEIKINPDGTYHVIPRTGASE